jgi:hypothetical protein
MKLQSQNRSFGKAVATVAIALAFVSAASVNAQQIGWADDQVIMSTTHRQLQNAIRALQAQPAPGAATQEPAAGAASCVNPYCTTVGGTRVGGPANPNVGGSYTDTSGRSLSDSVIGGTRGPIERIPDKSTGWPFCSSDRGRSCAPCNGNVETLGVSS